MTKGMKSEMARGFMVIENDLDIMILIALWALNYKTAFWIFLVLFGINTLVAEWRRNKMEKMGE